MATFTTFSEEALARYLVMFGLGQLSALEKLDELDARRQDLAMRYSSRLADLRGLELPDTIPDRRHAWHLYIVGVDPDRSGITRDELVVRLSERGVATSVHFIPVHYHPHYAKSLGYRRGQFPNAEKAFGRAVSLPLYPAMSDEDADHVTYAVRDALGA